METEMIARGAANVASDCFRSGELATRRASRFQFLLPCFSISSGKKHRSLLSRFIF